MCFVQLDILTGGAHVNPAVSVAFWVLGDVSLLGLAAKLLGQIAAGSLAFPLLRFLLPPYVQLGGKRSSGTIDCVCLFVCLLNV